MLSFSDKLVEPFVKKMIRAGALTSVFLGWFIACAFSFLMFEFGGSDTGFCIAMLVLLSLPLFVFLPLPGRRLTRCLVSVLPAALALLFAVFWSGEFCGFGSSAGTDLCLFSRDCSWVIPNAECGGSAVQRWLASIKCARYVRTKVSNECPG